MLDTIPVPGYNCVLDQELRVRSGDGVDFFNGVGLAVHFTLPQLPKYAQVDLLGLTDHHLGLLESTEGVLYTLDQQTGNWLRHPLAAPEFQAIRNLPPIEEGSIPFFSSPSVAGGEFYVLSNPTNRKQGAKVLRFDSQGKLRALPVSSAHGGSSAYGNESEWLFIPQRCRGYGSNLATDFPASKNRRVVQS